MLNAATGSAISLHILGASEKGASSSSSSSTSGSPTMSDITTASPATPTMALLPQSRPTPLPRVSLTRLSQSPALSQASRTSLIDETSSEPHTPA